MKNNLFTYKKSGVNIRSADKFVKFISNITAKKKAKKSLVILVVLDLLVIFLKTLLIQK